MNDDLVHGAIGVAIAGGVLLTVAFLSGLGATLQHEGGLVDDELDLGGRTNLGITESVALKHGYEVDSLTLEGALSIYHKDYWLPLRLDEVASVDSLSAHYLFDFGVNAGISRSGKILQRCLNALNDRGYRYPDIVVDGQVGDRTIEIVKHPRVDAVALRTCITGERIGHYLSITEARPANERFYRGWMLRVAE